MKAKKKGVVAHSLPRSFRCQFTLERELNAKTDDRVVGVVVVSSEVVSAVSKDAHAVEGFEASFDTATNKVVFLVFGVRAETTANESVRSYADGSDRVTEHEGAVELVVLSAGSEGAVRSLDTNVRGEEVFSQCAAAKDVVFAAAVREKSSAENTESESWSEGIATSFNNRGNSLAFFTGVANRTCENAGSESSRQDE